MMPRHDAGAIKVHEAQAFREAVVRALTRAHLAALDLKEVDRRLAVADLSCNTPECLARRAKLLNTRLLIGGRLEHGHAPGYSVALWLYDARRGSTVATVQGHCKTCDVNEAVARTGPLTVRLLEQALRTRGARIVVRSSPRGADVRIDGELVGVTDMTFGVKPGEHLVVVEHKKLGGRRKYKVRVGAGRKVVVDANLNRGAGAVAVGGINAGTWKWVSLGVGMAAAGAGAALLAIHGRQTCSKAAEHYQCPEQYDTRAPGIGLVVAGGVVLAGAGLLFYLDATSEDSGETVAAAPWVAGRDAGGLSAVVSF